MKKFIQAFLLSTLVLTSSAYGCPVQSTSENFKTGCSIINEQIKQTRCQKKIDSLKLVATKAGCEKDLSN